MQSALAESLRGIYLTGSAAVGAFRPGSSDLDVMVIADGATRAQLERVVATCSHAALPVPARKLELVVYDRDGWVLNLNSGEGEQHAGFDRDGEPGHWFVLDRAFAVCHAQALFGPPAAELVEEPGSEEIERAFTELVAWYEQNEPSGAQVARERAEHWRRTGLFATKAGATLNAPPP